MAVSFADKGTGSSTTLTVTTTATFSTSAASLIVIAVGSVDNVTRSVTNVTVGGSNATPQVSKDFGTGTHYGAALWTFWSSAALTSVNAVATLGGTGTTFAVIQATEATGTDVNSPGNNNSGGAAGATATVSVTASANGSVMIGMSVGDLGPTTAGTNTAYVRQDYQDANGDWYNTTNNTQAETSGNPYAQTVNYDSVNNLNWAMVGLEIKPAGAGGARLLSLLGAGN